MANWLGMKDVMFSAGKLDAARNEANGITRLLGLRPGAKILDLPCGLGRHTLELTHLGFELTGVDITAEFIKQAAAQSNANAARWQQGDMRTFHEADSFDAVLNLYTSFGYFKDPQDDLATLKNFLRNLKPGGRLLIDLMSRDIFLARVPPHYTEARGEDTTLEARHVFSPAESWLESTWTLVKPDERITLHSAMRLYSHDDILRLLHEAGFHQCQAYGDFDGSPYDENAQHLVMVAAKPTHV